MKVKDTSLPQLASVLKGIRFFGVNLSSVGKVFKIYANKDAGTEELGSLDIKTKNDILSGESRVFLDFYIEDGFRDGLQDVTLNFSLLIMYPLYFDDWEYEWSKDIPEEELEKISQDKRLSLHLDAFNKDVAFLNAKASVAMKKIDDAIAHSEFGEFAKTISWDTSIDEDDGVLLNYTLTMKLPEPM